MALKAAAVSAFQDSREEATSLKISKKMSAPMTMAAPIKMLLSPVDELVDVRAPKPDLLDVSVETSAITRTQSNLLA